MDFIEIRFNMLLLNEFQLRHLKMKINVVQLNCCNICNS